jgi:hypothetical protein
VPQENTNVQSVANNCNAPGVVCRFVGSIGCGMTYYEDVPVLGLADPNLVPRGTIGYCECGIVYTMCKKTLQQNRSQNIMKKQFKKQRRNFSGK